MIANELNSSNHGRAFQRKQWKLNKIKFFFKYLECFFLPILEKLLIVSQPDIACIAGSKEQIDERYSDVSECIGIYCFSLLVPVLNQIESNKERLVT